MEIKIIRSPKRRRTVSASLKQGTMIVHAPQFIKEHQLDKIVKDLQKRIEKRQLKKELNKTQDLNIIALTLNKKYFKGQLHWNSIAYSTNQTRKFGVCYFHSKRILISHRLAAYPTFVRNYVIVHELAHLRCPNHSQDFWDMVNQYPLTERARGYLLAVGMEDEIEENS